MINQVKTELADKNKENDALIKEITQIKADLEKNGNIDQTLQIQLNIKQEALKITKERVKQLEEHEKELQNTIKQKDEEINALQKTIEAQATEINRLNDELDKQMQLYIQQGQKIKELEGTIKGLEEANNRLQIENAELRQRIAELKQQLKDEKTAHEKTKKKLLDKDKELKKEKQNKLDATKNELKTLEDKWKNENITNRTWDMAEAAAGFIPGGAPALKAAKNARRIYNFVNWWK
ncbi:MAG: hypothetical protein ACQKHC_01675 [Candidatus Phytoplasma pruni]